MSNQLVSVSDYRPSKVRFDRLSHTEELAFGEMRAAYRLFCARVPRKQRLDWLKQKFREERREVRK
jgi:hypothetical protein